MLGQVIDCKYMMRIALVFHIIALMIFSKAWCDENLLFKIEVEFSPRRISWAHPLLSHQGIIANVTGDFREEYIAITEDEFFVFSTLLQQNYPNPIQQNYSNSIQQNYPNPIGLETWIPYQLPQNTNVVIRIYNTKGQLIRTITLGNKQAGIYVTKDKAAYWDGKDSLGQKVASGVYFYTLQAGEFKETRRMVIVK
jgi:hypothetical protein